MGPDCAFCRISVGHEPAEFVATWGRVFAIRPLEPHAPGHVLFVPRKHVAAADDDPGLAGEVFAAAAHYLGPKEGNLLASFGPAATQTVFHLHVHVVPRGPRDGLPGDWPWMRPDHGRRA